MSTARCLVVALCLGLGLFPVTQGPQAADAGTGLQPRKLVFVPPNRGAPRERVGGGTRGSADIDLKLEVLAPEEAGLSATDQPRLYWHTSKPAESSIELTVTTDDAIDPLVEKTVAPPLAGGLHALSLAEAGVKLRPGVTYRWSVAVVVDENQRSKDILASAAVQFSPTPVAAPDSSAADRAVALAGQGYWYDAFDVLSRHLAAQPADAEAAALRATLLAQVGLADLPGAP